MSSEKAGDQESGQVNIVISFRNGESATFDDAESWRTGDGLIVRKGDTEYFFPMEVIHAFSTTPWNNQ